MTTELAEASTALAGYQAQVLDIRRSPAMARRSEIGAHAFVYGALRRGTSGDEFAVPMQGRYLAELTGVTG